MVYSFCWLRGCFWIWSGPCVRLHLKAQNANYEVSNFNVSMFYRAKLMLYSAMSIIKNMLPVGSKTHLGYESRKVCRRKWEFSSAHSKVETNFTTFWNHTLESTLNSTYVETSWRKLQRLESILSVFIPIRIKTYGSVHNRQTCIMRSISYNRISFLSTYVLVHRTETADFSLKTLALNFTPIFSY